MDSFLKPIMLNSSKKYKISSKNGAFDPLIPRLKSYTAYHTVPQITFQEQVFTHFLSNFNKKIKNQSVWYFFVKSWVICVENITESEGRCQIEFFKVQKSHYNF